MNKKYYFNHLKNSTLTELIKIKFNSTIGIKSNTTGVNFTMYITSDGIKYAGQYGYGTGSSYYDARNQFSVYKNSNNEYFLCIKATPTVNYFTVEILTYANEGGAKLEYDESFDTTGLTLLTNLDNAMPVMNREVKYSPSVDANTVTEYISKCPFRASMCQCSLVMFSVWNVNTVGISALLLLHRKTASTLSDTPEWSVQIVYAESGISAFSVTGTKDGFTFTSNANYRYAITEIANPTDINLV